MNKIQLTQLPRRTRLRCVGFGTALVGMFFAATVSAQVIQLNNSEFDSLINKGVTVVDIRTAPEWKQTGVVADSKLITFFDERGQFDLNAWMEKFSQHANPDDPVVILCAAGVRSAAVTRVLHHRLGYREVYNLSRGIDDWMRQGGRTREWTPR